MRSIRITALAIVFATLLTAPLSLLAQQRVTRYTLYDVGTLGGNFGGFFETDLTGGEFTPSPLNSRGQLAGVALDASNFAGSYLWSQGTLTQLPSLLHANNFGGGSNATGINDAGLVVGISNFGVLSPFNHQPYVVAVTWTNGSVKHLPDLGGHGSFANSVNNNGLVAGFAYNSTPDRYSYFGTQLHAATWQNGTLQDLGTLGGTDSEAWASNSNGEVIGISFLNTPPLPPFYQPQDNAFLWSNGTMHDLGTLGGSFSTPTAINSSGQVTVLSFDANNQYLRSFVWSAGNKTTLNSVAGNNVQALTLNDAGSIAGANSDAGDVNYLAALWQPSGSGRLLGTVAGDSGSLALGINSHGVVVGGSGTIPTTAASSYAHAFVWQGGAIQDLNTLVPAGSSLTLNVAYAINESGVIAGLGTTSTGDTHAFVLLPASTSDQGFANASSTPVAPGSSIKMSSPMQRFFPRQLTRSAR